MNASVLKKTQDTLGKVIKKPPLTEKLLSKPPFRYLHDIITEVIRTTGFMNGLYGEAELKSENVKDKDTKIAFLQKAIDVVVMVSGEVLAVRPVRVVAGHDAERTNEFLQAIGRCCLNKLASEDAVKRVLAGDKPDPRGKSIISKSNDKENHEARERHRDKEKKRDIKDQSSSRDQKDPDAPKEPESRKSEKEKTREAERTKELEGRRSEKDKPREAEKRKESEGRRSEKEKPREAEKRKESEGKRTEKDRPRASERLREHEHSKDKSRDSERDKAKDRGRDRTAHKEKNRDKDREKRKERDRERHKDTEDREKDVEKPVRKARDPADEENEQPAEEPVRNGKQNSEAEEEQDKPARIPRPSSAKGQRQFPKTGIQDESDSDGGAECHLEGKADQLENGDMVDSRRTQTTLSSNRRLPRPSSARPAPPRMKRQESNTEGASAERLGSTKPLSVVIVDGRKLYQEEDDDEQFVVEEAAPLPPAMSELEADPDAELLGSEKHGGLVKKILETKKDFETSSSSAKSKDQERILVSQLSWKKERDLVSREMERLRTSVQTVCRSALPLGKIIDYIQEDVDSMQAELQAWRHENREHAQSLLEEQRITDNAVEPLKAELAQLEQLIQEQQDKICAIKSNILRNKEKIHKIISSISLSTHT